MAAPKATCSSAARSRRSSGRRHSSINSPPVSAPRTRRPARPRVWGDVEAGFKEADLIVEDVSYQQDTVHQPLESRTAMAYWQNGKLYLHGSTQSVSRTVASVAGWVGVPQRDVVIISEYCGGGFRQQDSGRADDGDSGAAVEEAEWPPGDDAHLARRGNLHRPQAPRLPGVGEDGVQEGRSRHGHRLVHHRRQRAVSSSRRQRSGGEPRDAALLRRRMRASAESRWRPTRRRGVSQRAPGGLQSSILFEPLVARAAKELGIDQVEIRKINAPVNGSQFGLNPPAQANRAARQRSRARMSRRRSIAAPSCSTGKSERSAVASAAARR